jgi:magnesium chelatase family protein
LHQKTPPYIAPHHSTTIPAMIGGGRNIQPGAISLAHP